MKNNNLMITFDSLVVMICPCGIDSKINKNLVPFEQINVNSNSIQFNSIQFKLIN